MTNCACCKYFQLAFTDHARYTRCAQDGLQVHADSAACNDYSPRTAGTDPDRVYVRHLKGELTVTPVGSGAPPVTDADIDDILERRQ